MTNVSRKRRYSCNTSLAAAMAMLALIVVFAGCKNEKEKATAEASQRKTQKKLPLGATASDRLNHYKHVWDDFAEKHYSYLLYIECYCQLSTSHNIRETPTAMIHDKWVKVEVKQKELVKVTLEGGQESEPFKEKFSGSDPIILLFGKIQSAVNLPAEQLSVVYDDLYGFPRQIEIVFTHAVDNVLQAEIREFELLN